LYAGSMRTPANKVALSDTLIAKIAVDRPTRYWDLRVPNLVAVALPSGSVTFYCYYSPGRKQKRWLRLANARSVTVEAARNAVRKIMSEVMNGNRDPVAEIAAQRSAGTVTDLIADFIAHKQRKGNKSWHQTERLLRGKFEPRFGKMRAANVTRSDVRKLAESMDGTPIMANQVLAAISSMFNFAATVDEYGVKNNPTKGVTRNVTKSRERTATAEEIGKVWPHMPDVCRLILLTGLRPGEARAIRSEWIEGGFVNFPASVMKGGEPHSVAIFDAIAPLVEAVKDRAWSKSAVGDQMRAGCKVAGIPDLRPQDCRRTWRSFAAAAGVPHEIAERMIAHKVGTRVSRTYNRYDHALEMRAAWEKTARKILQIVCGQRAEVSLFGSHSARV
jgi:integrase